MLRKSNKPAANSDYHVLFTQFRTIQDALYSSSRISLFAMRFVIDTPEFQRLRDLDQLGNCRMVFPQATHKRFEHSIGVYILTRKLLNIVAVGKWALTPKQQDLIAIAGLCHDIGHGPFSHLFDHTIAREIMGAALADHEDRSAWLLQRIMQRPIRLGLVTAQDLDNMCDLIKGQVTQGRKFTWPEWVLDTIHNKRNDIDVDKLDYLQRDSFHLAQPQPLQIMRLLECCRVSNNGNQLIYEEKAWWLLDDAFRARMRFTSEVYRNGSVVGYDLFMTKHILKPLSDLLDWPGKQRADSNFWLQLTDGYVLQKAREHFPKEMNMYDTRRVYKLVRKLTEADYSRRASVRKWVYGSCNDRDDDEHGDSFPVLKSMASASQYTAPVSDAKYEVMKINVGYTSRGDDVMSRVRFFNRKYPGRGEFPIAMESKTSTYSKSRSDTYYMVFARPEFDDAKHEAKLDQLTDDATVDQPKTESKRKPKSSSKFKSKPNAKPVNIHSLLESMSIAGIGLTVFSVAMIKWLDANRMQNVNV